MNNANEPAFPYTDGVNFAWNGMSKREYFASMAMQGLLSNTKILDRIPVTVNVDASNYLTRCSVELADSLLKQLEEK